MATSSSIEKSHRVEVSNIQLMRSDAFLPPMFHSIPKIAMQGDSNGVLSSILPMVIMIHDLWNCYMCKIGEVGDYKFEKLTRD